MSHKGFEDQYTKPLNLPKTYQMLGLMTKFNFNYNTILVWLTPKLVLLKSAH